MKGNETSVSWKAWEESKTKLEQKIYTFIMRSSDQISNLEPEFWIYQFGRGLVTFLLTAEKNQNSQKMSM